MVEVTDSVPNKEVGIEATQTSKSGKPYKTILTLEKSTEQNITCSCSFYFQFLL